MKKSIVISGIGIISPIGNNIEEFCQNLKKGVSGIDKITAFDTTGLRSKYGGEIKGFEPNSYFTRKDLRRMDRASQIALVAVKEAVEKSGIDFVKEEGIKCGISLGTTLGGMILGGRYYRDLYVNKKSYASRLLDYPLYSVGSRMCIEYGLLGTNLAISTACSSSNIAIGCGLDLIRYGNMDVMIVGGFDTMAELTCAGFGVMRNTSPDKYCRPFDKNRKGLLLGEGAGILIIEELEHCRRRGGKIIGEIPGYGMSSDAYHMTAPEVIGKGPSLAINNALEDSGINKEKIDYINAHGTGTTHNDLIETRAIKRIWGEDAYKIPVSSTKSMIGHTLGASGAIELIISLLAITEGFIPPTINYETKDPNCNLDYVPNIGRDQKVNCVLSNNFGFGGNNCSVIVRKFKEKENGKDKA